MSNLNTLDVVTIKILNSPILLAWLEATISHPSPVEYPIGEEEERQMGHLALMTVGLLLWPCVATAQSNNLEALRPDVSGPDDGTSGEISTTGAGIPQEFTPLTNSERARIYLRSAFGPGAIVKAAAAGAIAQANGKPKEWGGGADAFGERIGNAYAMHVIRKTLEHGGAFALHEDNRYIRSTETGFWPRSKHVIGSIFVARNDAGREHFAYSRFGSALGSSFISRIWMPPSSNSAGDAAVTFGITMATDIGGNFLREFMPSIGKRFRKH